MRDIPIGGIGGKDSNMLSPADDDARGDRLFFISRTAATFSCRTLPSDFMAIVYSYLLLGISAYIDEFPIILQQSMHHANIHIIKGLERMSIYFWELCNDHHRDVEISFGFHFKTTTQGLTK